MRENISENAKQAVMNFRKLTESNKLYTMSVILNHLYNGLINDGNYSSNDEAYENDKVVVTSNDINLDDPNKLATNLLIIGAKKDGLTINPNGIDIEPYIKDIDTISPVLSDFYNLDICDKVDFITEITYDISEIKEVEELNFDFNELIDELLSYRKSTFGGYETDSLEVETFNN